MSSLRLLRVVGFAAAMVLLTSGCAYLGQANTAADNGTPVPWFCNPTAPNSVTGPGMGTVDWYAGTTRQPLDYAKCSTLGAQMDLAKAYAKQYPTVADAEAAGMRSTFAFIPGMGTHHGKDSISPALLADPTFDRNDPIIPNSIIDGVFDPAKPEFLQYNGNGPEAILVGMSYYVRTTNGLPPAGFAGNNDWWHHHPTLCMRPTTAQAFGVNTTDAACATQGGINVHLQNYYMLHVWLVDDLEYFADVHAPMHPCITSTGAIWDMNDPCHTSASGGAAARTPASASTDEAPVGFCPIGMLNKENQAL